MFGERMTEQDILKKFKQYGVIITNSHFVYHLWNHGNTYVNEEVIYHHPVFTSDLCKELAHGFSIGNIVDVVVGPDDGGRILSQGTAYHLSCLCNHEVLAIRAEKTENGDFSIRSRYNNLIKGKKVLIVEDILTTGDSVRKVIETVYNNGGIIIGVGALCNRGNVKEEDIGTILHSLISINLNTLSEEECAEHGLCSKGVPINTEFGHGKEFLACQ